MTVLSFLSSLDLVTFIMLFWYTAAVFLPEPDWLITQDCPVPVVAPEPVFTQDAVLLPLPVAAS